MMRSVPTRTLYLVSQMLVLRQSADRGQSAFEGTIEVMRILLTVSSATLLLVTGLSGAGHYITGTTARAADSEQTMVRSDAPSQYTVVEGDTLWGVAGQFLNDPWRWPEIWKANTHIKNPNLIFPGDVVMMNEDGTIRVLRKNTVSASASASTTGAGRDQMAARTIKLSPTIYTEALERAIPVISPRAIQPFLTIPLVVDDHEMQSLGYVATGVDDNLILGKHQQFFARGIPPSDDEHYQIFRPGRPLVDPDSEEVLGHEAIYLGDARLLETGETARFELTRSQYEIGPKDRLIPTPRNESLPYYFPRSPGADVRGRIISATEGVSEVGRYSVVVVNVGDRPRRKYRAADGVSNLRKTELRAGHENFKTAAYT